MTMKVRYTVIDGEIIAEKRNGVRKQYVPDSLGSTVALLDNTQTPTDTFTYWPYGEVASRTGTTPTPFQYVGTQGYYHDNSARDYVRARHLGKDKGRWLSQDPIRFEGEDHNLYRYVRNNVTTATDPSGYNPFRCSIQGEGRCHARCLARNCIGGGLCVKILWKDVCLPYCEGCPGEPDPRDPEPIAMPVPVPVPGNPITWPSSSSR